MTYDSCPCGNIHLCEILPAVPLKRCSEEPRPRINSLESTIVLGIRVQNDTISTFLLNTNTIICVTLRRMEIEDPKETSTLKNNDFV